MPTFKLIAISPDGAVTMDSSDMFAPMSARDESIQRIALALINRAASNIDAPGYGAGVKEYLGSLSPQDLVRKSAEVIDSLNASLALSEDPTKPYAITSVELISSTVLTRGVAMQLRVNWNRAEAESLTFEVI